MDDGDLRLGGMTTEQTEKVFQFQELTGIEDVSICRDVLQRHAWDLEVAVQDQLNIREGRPSMFSATARLPSVVTDSLALLDFSPRPREDENGGGLRGLLRFVVNLVFKVCYSSVASVIHFALHLFKKDSQRILTDPLADVLDFVTEFDEKYSASHPVFYQGTYAQAVSDAKQELRYLLVFLHNESYPDSEEMCRNALAYPEVIEIVNQHMFLWACNVKTGEGYRVSVIMRERSYPFMAVIVLRDGRMTVVARMEGAADGPELARRLRSVMHDNEASLISERADRMERSFNRSLRSQQDEAYEQSLMADREKERGRREARQLQEHLESELRRAEREKGERKLELERLKVELLDRIPEEPDPSNPDTVRLVIKLPSGTRLERRFLKTHSIMDVYNFVFCQPTAPDSFEIATNFPKRKLDTHSNKTLAASGFQKGEVLFVYDLDA